MNPFQGSDSLIYRGDAVKSLGGNRVGGWLVKFGDPEHTDLSELKDYFTKETDFGPFTKSSILYFHGGNPALGRTSLGVGDIAVKDAGVWIEGELALRDKYERAVKKLVDDGKLGWSSGTAMHLMEREAQKNGSHRITRWPLGLDASLTPAPAEPRAEAVALKSLDLGGLDALKGMNLGPYAEVAATMAGVRSLADDLHCALWRWLSDQEKTPEERVAACAAAVDEYRGLALRCIRGMAAAIGDDEASAAVKTIVRESLARLASGRPYGLHASTVATAVKDLASRSQRRLAARSREGRPSFPAAALKDLRSAHEDLGTLLAGMAGGNVSATTAGATKSAADQLRAELLRLSLTD